MTDPRVRCRFLWMEAFVRNGASDHAGGVRASRESRECARKAGSFHQYFVATHTLVTALAHSGDLGEAMRVARETAEMAATNHHLLEQYWLESKQAFVAMEAFDFANALPMCERIASEPMMMRYSLTPHVLLWLGLARLGTGAFVGASDALARLEAVIDSSGVGFEYRFPLLQGQASCAWARGERDRAKTLFARSIQLAVEYRALGYAAKGHRQLAEMSIQENDLAGAEESISAAMSLLHGVKVLNVEWQVYATAGSIFAALGRYSESEKALGHAVRVADQVASTLAGEPGLRQSFLRHVQKLTSAASAC